MTSRTASSCLKLAKCLDGRESRDKLYAKLTEMLTKLDIVKENANLFIQVVGVDKSIAVKQDESSGSRVTSSILPATEIFGRVEDRNKMVDLLKRVDEPESSSRNIPIITIISEGGVGKTMLAQIVYNDKEVKEHFDLRMWVCVSNGFNKIQLTKEMLESASGKHADFVNFDMLAKSLEAKMELRRFLLVLDDVWYDKEVERFENEGRWTDLFSPLKVGARGSKILVTTRDTKVAEMLGQTYKYDLKCLDDHDCWELFASCAFSNRNLGNHPELQAIGMQIVQRLNGLPLAAKVVGGLLKDHTDAEEWKTIFKELIQGNIPAYRLGYERLPEHLKPCIAYCSIFPKDWKFKPEKLILLWIAQDYIQAPNRHDRPKPMVDIGMDYFIELLSRSFFEKVERDSSVYYVIHDLIHDLAQSVAKDECFRIDSGKESILKDTIRHLGIVVRGGDVDLQIQLKKISNLKKLRTLIFFGGRWMSVGRRTIGMLKEARRLRVLDLGELYLKKFFGGLNHLLHLRYLNAGDCGHYTLPKSWCGLYHLQVLGAKRSLQFSKSMIRLIKFGKLTYFDAEKLGFQVEKERGNRIEVLKDIVIFKHGLRITNLVNFSYKEEVIEADLGSQQCMRGLELQWGWWQNINGHNAGEEIAEALKPHPNLEELTIEGFGGIRSPSWLETKWLINVQTIHLSDCKNLEALPPLGHLPLLKELQIQSMNAIKRVGGEFYSCNENESEGVRVGFPSLEMLWFSEMPEWLEWSGVEFPVFPRLRRLRIWGCPKLVSLLEGARMSSLESLDIRDFDVSDASLARLLRGLTLLSELKIHDCRNLRSLGGLHALDALKYLMLSNCPGVKSMLEEGLPASIEHLELYAELTSLGGLGALTSLKHLEVHDCRKMKSLPEEGLPASIEHLELEGCKELTSLGGLGALTSLKRLVVGSCPRVKSLPEEGLPTSIEHLLLWGCEKLTSLGGLRALTSLRYLGVNYCRKVKSLPEEGLPASIVCLHLWQCNRALKKQIRRKKGPEWDKVAHIPHIKFTLKAGSLYRW